MKIISLKEKLKITQEFCAGYQNWFFWSEKQSDGMVIIVQNDKKDIEIALLNNSIENVISDGMKLTFVIKERVVIDIHGYENRIVVDTSDYEDYICASIL